MPSPAARQRLEAGRGSCPADRTKNLCQARPRRLSVSVVAARLEAGRGRKSRTKESVAKSYALRHARRRHIDQGGGRALSRHRGFPERRTTVEWP